MQPINSNTSAKVAFVNMPWAKLEYGSLALGLLKSVLREHDIESDVFYLNLLFSNYMVQATYKTFADESVVSEYYFSPGYYDIPYRETIPTLQKVADCAGLSWALDAMMQCVSRVPDFVSVCMSIIDWRRYEIVGFTINFCQLLSSLCLAKSIKESNSNIKIVFGGSGCTDVMGVEIIRSFPEVDFVFQGEAERSIVPFTESILNCENNVEHIKGICLRKANEPYVTSGISLATDLDSLPFPDYSDYFLQKEVFAVRPVSEMVSIESSRGCWWGEKKACTFCGLNQLQMKYRSKSQERFFDEICHYVNDLGLYNFFVTDNILDMKYFDVVIPKLIELRKQHPITLFYEIKSNLNREHVQQLRKAGVIAVQPGIESFSDHILGLMSKGAREKHSIQILKFCTEEGINLVYNVLEGFPGEKAEDYEMMIKLTPYIRHLMPPETISPIALHRFSVYFENKEKYDLRQVRPNKIYHYIFERHCSISLEDIAYHFTFIHHDNDEAELTACRRRFRQTLQDWQNNYRANTLVYDVVDSHEIIVFDNRDHRSALVKLDREMSELALNCLEFTRLARLRKRLQHISEERLLQIIREFIAKGWMYKTSKNECIFLPVRRFFYAEIKKRQMQDEAEVDGIGVSQ